MPKKTPKPSENRCLLATMTKEPFQPVRLYYSIPDRSFVTERLRGLKCVVEVPHERCCQWLFHVRTVEDGMRRGVISPPVGDRSAPMREES